MKRVLVVDDNAPNRYLLRQLFESSGYAVDAAENGLQALTQARLNPPGALITDLLMPEMDGYALLRQWNTDPALQRIPSIVYTATYTDPEDERMALELGADAFVVKPMDGDKPVSYTHLDVYKRQVLATRGCRQRSGHAAPRVRQQRRSFTDGPRTLAGDEGALDEQLPAPNAPRLAPLESTGEERGQVPHSDLANSTSSGRSANHNSAS